METKDLVDSQRPYPYSHSINDSCVFFVRTFRPRISAALCNLTPIPSGVPWYCRRYAPSHVGHGSTKFSAPANVPTYPTFPRGPASVGSSTLYRIAGPAQISCWSQPSPVPYSVSPFSPAAVSVDWHTWEPHRRKTPTRPPASSSDSYCPFPQRGCVQSGFFSWRIGIRSFVTLRLSLWSQQHFQLTVLSCALWKHI